MYHPGALDQIISIYSIETESDNYGGEREVERLISKEWALAKPLNGGEKKDQERLHDTAKYLFVIRFRKDIKEDQFVKWDGATFQIRYVPSKGSRKLYLEIEAERNANQ